MTEVLMDKIGLKYVGGGIAIMAPNTWVPTRDLSPEEVKLYGGKRALKATGYYVDPPQEDDESKESEVIDDGS
jgi:hypothetical protein